MSGREVDFLSCGALIAEDFPRAIVYFLSHLHSSTLRLPENHIPQSL